MLFNNSYMQMAAKVLNYKFSKRNDTVFTKRQYQKAIMIKNKLDHFNTKYAARALVANNKIVSWLFTRETRKISKFLNLLSSKISEYQDLHIDDPDLLLDTWAKE